MRIAAVVQSVNATDSKIEQVHGVVDFGIKQTHPTGVEAPSR